MWTQFLFLLLCVDVVLGRHCWECKGHEECLSPRNVSCEHNRFGCAKLMYESEPFIEKGCLYSKQTQKLVKLTTCTRKQQPNGDEKYWQCGCMGKDNCNSSTGMSSSSSSTFMFIAFVFAKYIY